MGVKVEKTFEEKVIDGMTEALVHSRTDKFDKLTLELLTHKYHYYMKDSPIISDYDYDKLERQWVDLGKTLDIDMDNYPNWIGFDENHPLAKDVKK